MEIVFGPHLSHGEEAGALVKELILILETLDCSKARMEQGEVRVDANISVRRSGDPELGVRTEVKNINSVRSVVRAVEYEVMRQIAVLEQGGVVENETRSFDYNSKITVPMRDKEAKQDYRFMPEPNLPPLRLSDSSDATSDDGDLVNIERVRSEIPELPAETRTRLTADHGLSEVSSAQLVQWPALLHYFRLCCGHSPSSHSEVVNLIFSIVQHQCLTHNIEPCQVSLSPEMLVQVSNMRQEKLISSSGLQQVISLILSGDKRSVRNIVSENNLFLIRDDDFIDQFVEDIIKNNHALVDKYQREKNPKKIARVYQSLVTIVNKDSRVDKVDMVLFTEKLKQRLNNKDH